MTLTLPHTEKCTPIPVITYNENKLPINCIWFCSQCHKRLDKK
jgi:hypothetical protein